MKALIFNSGIGKRMGDLTLNNPKSMVRLIGGESIFERQIRILSYCGIKDFVITTGPYEEQLVAVANDQAYSDCRFTFVHNPKYDSTNYIYSFYLAREYLDDDVMMLHGDLVFDRAIVENILNSEYASTCCVNYSKALPLKDFKGRIINGKLAEVSINIFDNDCFAFQPLYKLSKNAILQWLDAVTEFIESEGIDSVYAENALNTIIHRLDIHPLSYENHYVEEVDNAEDYFRVKNEIVAYDYQEQIIVEGLDGLATMLNRFNVRRPLVVLDSFLLDSDIRIRLEKEITPTFFSQFSPNPVIENAISGVSLYQQNKCDGIISIGGGSAIDVGKAIKHLLLNCGDTSTNTDGYHYKTINFIAVPTTAGTGSESTHFAAVYYNGTKKSLTSPVLLPNAVVLDKSFILTLPQKQKRSTLLDALCQATESMWSVKANDTSMEYATKAIGLIVSKANQYLNGSTDCLGDIQRAANLAGKAINISETTAAHAMSYKVTSLFNVPHGDAVALCMLGIWPLYNSAINTGTNLQESKIANKIAEAYGTDNINAAFDIFCKICRVGKLNYDLHCTPEVFDEIVRSVNLERLENFPVRLSQNDIVDAYSSFIMVLT